MSETSAPTGTTGGTTTGAPAGSSTATPDRDGLARSSGVMALGTALSRVTGFARSFVLTAALGTALLADTYNVAHSLPTILYILLAGGVLNAVFVPQLVRAMKDSPDGGKGYADRLLSLTILVLLALTVVATLAAPLVVALYAPKFDAVTTSVTVAFAFWSLPQIFFYGLFTMLGQVLNARSRFGPMMWAPILNNVIVIASALLFLAVADVRTVGADAPATIDGAEIALLGAGSTLGVVVQTLVLLPALRRSGYSFSFRTDFRGFGLRHAASLAKWTLAFVAVNQLGYLVVTRVGTAVSAEATQLGYGVGFTAYQNAYLIFLLPHGIITVSVVTALLPRMSRAAAEGRLEALRADLGGGLRMCAGAIAPAAVALAVLGPDLAGVLFAPAGAESARYIGWVLTAFAPGLLFFTAHYLALRGFYAQEDTRTPFRINLWITAVNVALVLLAYAVLPVRWVTVAMAASYSLSYVVGMLLSLRLLSRRTGGVERRPTLRAYLRLVSAAVVAGLPALGVARVLSGLLGDGLVGSLAALLAGGSVLLVVYLPLARRARVAEFDSLLAMVRGRLRR